MREVKENNDAARRLSTYSEESRVLASFLALCMRRLYTAANKKE
jgi:hypothetical protein